MLWIQQTLHLKYTLLILRETREKLMALPNISKATTRITKQITICGELQVIEKLIFLCISNLMLVWISHVRLIVSRINQHIFAGDLHGKLDDLFMIFHKASESQPDSILTVPNFAVTSLYGVHHKTNCTSPPLKFQNAEHFLIIFDTNIF